jgi:hypothetical protein
LEAQQSTPSQHRPEGKDVMVSSYWKKKILHTKPAQKQKNGASGNAWTTALACLAAVFWFMAIKNIPSLTGQSRFHEKW